MTGRCALSCTTALSKVYGWDVIHVRENQQKNFFPFQFGQKIALIVRRNPHWLDLAAEWYPWMKSGAGRDASTPQ